jgi:hypothetical protein
VIQYSIENAGNKIQRKNQPKNQASQTAYPIGGFHYAEMGKPEIQAQRGCRNPEQPGFWKPTGKSPCHQGEESGSSQKSYE